MTQNLAAEILIVDDDEDVCKSLTEIIRREGYRARPVGSLCESRVALRERTYDLVLLDVRLADGCGLELLEEMRRVPDPPEVIVLTGVPDRDGARTAMFSGVWDYLLKPPTRSGIREAIQGALRHRREKKHVNRPGLQRDEIAGNGTRIRGAIEQATRAAASDLNVLITGETGTGKELFAHAIHRSSCRSTAPFIVADCAAMPENLVESLLFGFEKGAFTGADRARTGLMSLADGGTLFLDEVGELPPESQKVFLRALESRRFRPIGATAEQTSDFRLIAATNRNLEHEVERGRFRSDLLFRIRGLCIELPPLRERIEDLPELVCFYLKRRYRGIGAPPVFSPEIMTLFAIHAWPGNIREFIQTVDVALLAASGESIVQPLHLPAELRLEPIYKICQPTAERPFSPNPDISLDVPANPTNLVYREFRRKTLEDAERNYFLDLLRQTGHDIAEVCRRSGLSRARLYELLKKYDLTRAPSP